MQAIVETVFDAVYLVSVITIGILMIRGSNPQFRLFGLMAVVLGAGDSFHLIPVRWRSAPRVWKLHRALGLGKWITSVTMTIFMCCSTMCGVSAIRSRAEGPDRRRLRAGRRASSSA